MEPLRTLINSGYDRAKRGEYRLASEDFRIILSHNPNHTGALYGLAACQFRLSDPEAALLHLRHLLALQPNHPQALRLKDEIEQLALQAAGYGGPVENSMNAELGEHDPFGTGLDKKSREVEVLAEWNSPGRDAPGFFETLAEGGSIQVAPFRVGATYRSALNVYRRDFRRAFLASAAMLYLGVGLIAPYAADFRDWIREGAPVHLLQMVILFFSLPFLGFYAHYAHRLLSEHHPPFSALFGFFKAYPHLIFCQGWMFTPALVGAVVLYAVSIILGFFTTFAIADTVASLLLPAGALTTFYVWWRCWFLQQILQEFPEEHPLTVLGRAWGCTRGQQIRLIGFSLLQTLLGVMGLVSCGLLLPIPYFASEEAYQQMREIEDKTDGGIGFRPRRKE